MRRYVLILGVVEALIWLGVTIWASRQPRHVDIAGMLHLFFFVLTVPGLVLGILNKALKTATWLVSIVAFELFCVAVGSQISS